MTRQRVAVLIDGDNVSPKHSAQILIDAATLGQLDIARVYTCGQRNSDWLSMPGYRYMHAGAGKTPRTSCFALMRWRYRPVTISRHF